MTNEELENIIFDLEDYSLDREFVLKNNSIEKTADVIVKEMLPSIQLRMMNLSEIDKNHFMQMEKRKEDNTISEDEEDYYFEYVSDKFDEDIKERCLNQDLWSTKEEYQKKWEKQFPKKAKEIESGASVLLKEIESSNAKMEEEQKNKVVGINSKKDREENLAYLTFLRKELIGGFNRVLIDQMEYDNEGVYEDLNLEVTKKVEQVVEKEARLVVQPYITKEVAESYGDFSHSGPEVSASKK